MNLIKQNKSGLPSPVQKWGCKMRCLQAIAEFSEGQSLSAYDILTIYESFTKKNNPKIMNQHCETGTQEDVIINNAFYRLRLDEARKAKMVGSRDSQGDTWGRQEGDFIMKDFKTFSGKHFVLFDKDDNEIFDPWDGHLERLGVNKIMFYKVF